MWIDKMISDISYQAVNSGEIIFPIALYFLGIRKAIQILLISTVTYAAYQIKANLQIPFVDRRVINKHRSDVDTLQNISDSRPAIKRNDLCNYKQLHGMSFVTIWCMNGERMMRMKAIWRIRCQWATFIPSNEIYIDKYDK